MSISKGWASFVASLFLVLVASLVSCGPPTNCLRYSDCAEGLTCANGRCVPPPAPLPDGGLEDGAPLAGDDAGGSTGGPTPDSSVAEADGSRPDATDDAGTAASDAETGGDARSDAGGDATAE